MTQEGLKHLKKLEWKVHELQDKAEGLKTRIQNFYWYEEDVLDRDAHTHLTCANESMKDAISCITDALLELQKAYDAEKEVIAFYEGLLNKEYEEHF